VLGVRMDPEMSIQRLRAERRSRVPLLFGKGGAFWAGLLDWGQRTNEKERPRCYAR